MGTAVRPAKTSSGPWDAFADVAVFVDEVVGDAGLPELERMNSTTTIIIIIIIPRTCVITPKAVSNGWARIGVGHRRRHDGSSRYPDGAIAAGGGLLTDRF